MQKIIFIFLISLSFGCMKNEVETINEEIDTTNIKILYSGQFESGSNPTSGKISVVEDQNGVRKLQLENLKSDSGPDLRLYLSENRQALNSIEIITAPKNGTYTLDLPANIDFEKHKFVLIWCKRFSKLFGSAELKK
jgi:hypothetical protein